MEPTNRKRAFLLGTLLLASPWLLVQGWILVGAPTPDHTRMPNCPEATMNCASLSSTETVRMDTSLTTLIAANVSDVWDAWENWANENGLQSVHETMDENGERFAHGVAITPFWRFPDDVVVHFVPEGEDTRLSIYSASRLGQGDLGVNPNRLESLHTALVAVQGAS